jgi:hypothetical protein
VSTGLSIPFRLEVNESVSQLDDNLNIFIWGCPLVDARFFAEKQSKLKLFESGISRETELDNAAQNTKRQ